MSISEQNFDDYYAHKIDGKSIEFPVTGDDAHFYEREDRAKQPLPLLPPLPPVVYEPLSYSEPVKPLSYTDHVSIKSGPRHLAEKQPTTDRLKGFLKNAGIIKGKF